MKNLLFVLLAVFIVIAACTKTKDKNLCSGVNCQNNGYCVNGVCNCPTGYKGTYCETEDTTAVDDGKIDFVNNTLDPYRLYIAGNDIGILNGKSTRTVKVAYGTYSCEIIQQSGYTSLPAQASYTAVVSASQDAVISF